MSQFELGCYVVHAKLPDLGSGEVLSAEKGAVRIRFASGERSFSLLLLLGGILGSVRVEDLAVRAELLDVRLELRAVRALVPGRLVLRKQERDRPALAPA